MKRWTITLLAASCAAGAVWAADGSWKPAVPKEMNRADFVRHAEARFDALDADKNGVVTEAERKNGWEARRGNHKALPDQTEAQYLDAAKARFQQLDADQNGTLTAAERQAAMHKHHGRHHGGKMGPWPQGDVSRVDFVRQAEARFDALDADKNGIVTSEEFKAKR
ncbi:MAG TPA: hypothetical protein VLC08_09650 [Chitinolyticbacter sp.]|nr:hypothetical protein [Chitinolyticbacter sp.]